MVLATAQKLLMLRTHSMEVLPGHVGHPPWRRVAVPVPRSVISVPATIVSEGCDAQGTAEVLFSISLKLRLPSLSLSLRPPLVLFPSFSPVAVSFESQRV